MDTSSGDYSFLYPTLEELRDPEVAEIQGVLPKWACGTLIRTGPGKFDFGEFSVNHFLDGYALLTRFVISENKICYDRRFADTDAYKKAILAGMPVIQEFGTRGQKPDPTKGLLTRFIPHLIPEISDNCNVSLFSIGKELFAAADTSFFRQVDIQTLGCGEKFDTSKLFGLNMVSAHPLEDNDGFIYNIGTSFITGLKYNVVKIPIPHSNQSAKENLKSAKIIASIPSSHALCSSPCHSFGKTDNYIILIEQPLVIVAKKVLAGLLHKSCNREYMEYLPEVKNRFHVVDKKSGKVVTKGTLVSSEESFFFLHFINCYEEQDAVVVDLCAFPNANCIHYSLEDFRKGFEGRLEDLAEGRRFVIPLLNQSQVDVNANKMPAGHNLLSHLETTATATLNKEKNNITLQYERLTEQGIEVPTVHPEFRGKKYSIFFGGGPRAVGPYQSSICKFNVKTKRCEGKFRLGDNEFLGEPLFVPSPGDSSEDSGILITCLTRAKRDSLGGLIFINAKNMTEVARAEFQNFVPLAIHGIFVPDCAQENDKEMSGC